MEGLECVDLPVEAGAERKQVLIVKHLPDNLSMACIKSLFGQFGASDVRRGRQSYFVEFKDDAAASFAQKQLHRVRLLGKLLAVEFVKQPQGNATTPTPARGGGGDQTGPVLRPTGGQTAPADAPRQPPLAGTPGASGASLAPPVPPPAVGALPQNQSLQSNGGRQNYSTGVVKPRGEAIAPSLGVDYPFPPHLQYSYPPPDGNILANIMNALIAVPRLYTQVLHLMNKMNLPAPFCPATPTPPLPPAPAAAPPLPPPSAPPPSPPPPPPPTLPLGASAAEHHQLLSRGAGASSSESELLSDREEEEEEEDGEGSSGATRRKKSRKGSSRGGGGGIQSMEAAGVKPAVLVPKSIAIRKRKQQHPSLLPMKIGITSLDAKAKAGAAPLPESPAHSSKRLHGGGGGGGWQELEEGQQQNQHHRQQQQQEAEGEEEAEEDEGHRRRATRSELRARQMAPDEILRISKFKNYVPGDPSQLLYVKNLAPSVTSEDLLFIYAAFFPSYDAAKQVLGVRLMQEGRMKGQAFIQFPSVESAGEAMRGTHGYVFKDKPMIVAYGRKQATAND